LAVLRVVGEERAQMDVAYAGEVVPQRLPRGKCVRQGRRRGRGHRAHPARLSDVLLLTRLASRSFQDLTKASAPSRWRVAASSPPARAKSARTASASPPSCGSIAPTSPWSPTACSVFSGMVLIVCGAASAVTYRTSDSLGSFVPVLAHRRRCDRPPKLRRRS